MRTPNYHTPNYTTEHFLRQDVSTLKDKLATETALVVSSNERNSRLATTLSLLAELEPALVAKYGHPQPHRGDWDIKAMTRAAEFRRGQAASERFAEKVVSE